MKELKSIIFDLMKNGTQAHESWRNRVYKVIFESDTPAGKAFDVALLVFILLSVLVVMLDSIQQLHEDYGTLFYFLEWFFTIIFSIEYILRLISAPKASKYALSFLGVIDVLSILPTFLSLLLVGAQTLLVLRVLRLLRIFRIFKLNHFLTEMKFLGEALTNSARKISIFMLCVLFLVIILGSLMYIVEGSENGFTNIPTSIYWAIVTITTVGYGDISPLTPFGKFLASIIMLLGYGILAVPTGIVTTEMAFALRQKTSLVEKCNKCGCKSNDADSRFCKMCGDEMKT